jgi:hypothetical protein
MAATAVIGFVIDARRKIVSRRTGGLPSRVMEPIGKTWVSSGSTWLGARRDFYPLISDNRHDLTGGVSQRDRVVHVDRVLKTSQTRDPICESVRNRT